MYQLINGKEVAGHIKQQVKNEIEALGLNPALAVIVVGDNPASKVYVNNKKKACKAVGIESIEYSLPESITEEELLNIIDYCNISRCIHGILVQLPLPKHINEGKILERIYPDKGFKALVIRILVELGKRKDEHNENYLGNSSWELSKVGT